MSRKMPPLQTLRAFDEASKRSSFTAAGEALNISQSAVSQQVGLLESTLGVKLFKRRPHPLVLTDAGTRFAAAIGHALDLVEQATLDVQQAFHRSLIVAATPSLATRWLTPRLADFGKLHDDLEITLYPAFEPPEMRRAGAEIGILYGAGTWRGWNAELLARESIYPVCSKGFIAEQGLPTLENLFSYPLLRDADVRHEYWPIWLSAAGSTRQIVDRGPKFDSLTDMITAALNGQGIALARGLLVRDDVAAGRLVRLFDVEAHTRFAYHLVWSDRADPAMCDTMRSWLHGEIELQKDNT